MKITKILSLLLAFMLVMGIFAGCSKKEEKKQENKAEEVIPTESPEEEKGPTDEELIEEVLTAASEAARAFDAEKVSEYVLDDSDLEKELLSIEGEIDDGIEQINKGVSKEIDNHTLIKYVGDDVKNTIKDMVAEGLEKGKQAIIDSVELTYGEKTIDGDKATVDVTVKVGGKKILPLLSGGNNDKAMDMVMEYLDKTLEKRNETILDLAINTKEIAEAVIEEIVNDIKNGEKEEFAFVATLEKIDGEWIITAMEEAKKE
ncbi:MAG: hypothetical protein IJO61_04385 [Oscillospiraceae bacterium]|nr:hypothetical protein [Oscillospiraceae bacterium]